MIENWINRILPSLRTQYDPAVCTALDNSDCAYQPIVIGDLKLTPLIRREFYNYRKNPVLVDTPRYDKKLAVIVPYRNREQHLKVFPRAIKEFLARQHIENDIYVIEQADQKPFNKGRLINIGAKISANNSDYYCLHDVDMLPEVADYGYINYPVLLAKSVSQFDQQKKDLFMQHETYFGGVVLFRKEDFYKINGYSNEYWHWGYEDDDSLLRCLFSGLIPVAYKTGRFRSLPHEKSIKQTADGKYHEDKETLDKLHQLYLKNKERYKKMRRGQLAFTQEGLSQLTYKIVKEQQFDDYKMISVLLL